MSYPMTHLLIADNYIKKHDFSTEEEALFLLASNAPDAVHAKADYNPHMKGCSHILVAGYEWGHIFEEEPLNLWYQCLKKFYNDNINNNINHLELAFLQGYTLHILVDIYNCNYIYAPNYLRNEQSVENFRKDYRKQNLSCDYYLYLNSKNSLEMFSKINKGIELLEENPNILEHLGLDQFISCNDISSVILEHIMSYKKSNSVTIDDKQKINPAVTMKFIEDVSSHAEKHLFNFTVEDHMFKIKI